MPYTLLLHNARATHVSRRFTHPNEKIMCVVHIGTFISGQGGRKVGRIPQTQRTLKPLTKQKSCWGMRLGEPGAAEQLLLQDHRPSVLLMTRPHLWHQLRSRFANLLVLQIVMEMCENDGFVCSGELCMLKLWKSCHAFLWEHMESHNFVFFFSSGSVWISWLPGLMISDLFWNNPNNCSHMVEIRSTVYTKNKKAIKLSERIRVGPETSAWC